MALMTMSGFVDQYCSDLKAMRDSILTDPFASFRRDEVIDGVPIILDRDGREIPVEEIVQLTFQEFVKAYPHSSSAEAFKNYVSAYKITSGEELFFEVNKEIAERRDELKKLSGKSIRDVFSI